jgi:hypothetical protein
MVICGVVASESLLTYDPVRSGGKQHSSVTLEGIAQGAQRAPVEYCHGPTMSALCALHLTHS